MGELVAIARITVADEHCWDVIDLCGKHFGKPTPEADRRFEQIMARMEAEKWNMKSAKKSPTTRRKRA